MLKKLSIILSLIATPAFATQWATGDCTLANGGKIRYMVHNGKGFISYDDSDPYEMFSEREGDFGIIKHIGDSGNMVMAVNLKTGRGYVITKFDNGKQVEKNLSCKLSLIER
jgi:hypothetical protein